MREIKFRAWDKKKKEMFPVHEIQWHKIDNVPCVIKGYDNCDSDGWDFHGGGNMLYAKENRYELMQFIGLLDKNGTMIFEGDIVKFPSHGDTIAISDVAWEEGAFVVKDNVDYYDTVLESSRSAKCIVIGNIHQNPELLGAE